MRSCLLTSLLEMQLPVARLHRVVPSLLNDWIHLRQVFQQGLIHQLSNPQRVMRKIDSILPVGKYLIPHLRWIRIPSPTRMGLSLGMCAIRRLDRWTMGDSIIHDPVGGGGWAVAAAAVRGDQCQWSQWLMGSRGSDCTKHINSGQLVIAGDIFGSGCSQGQNKLWLASAPLFPVLL